MKVLHLYRLCFCTFLPFQIIHNKSLNTLRFTIKMSIALSLKKRKVLITIFYAKAFLNLIYVSVHCLIFDLYLNMYVVVIDMKTSLSRMKFSLQDRKMGKSMHKTPWLEPSDMLPQRASSLQDRSCLHPSFSCGTPKAR